MTSNSQFRGLQREPANPLVMFCAEYPKSDHFPILLPEPGSPSEAAAGSGLPSKVCVMESVMRSEFPALPTGSSHFGETVTRGYPETALKKFRLPGTARAQE